MDFVSIKAQNILAPGSRIDQKMLIRDPAICSPIAVRSSPLGQKIPYFGYGILPKDLSQGGCNWDLLYLKI